MRGAWIEIVNTGDAGSPFDCRSPCGERGLKFYFDIEDLSVTLSLPMRGAWIEM